MNSPVTVASSSTRPSPTGTSSSARTPASSTRSTAALAPCAGHSTPSPTPATGETIWTIDHGGTFRPAIDDISATIVSALDAATGTTRGATRTAGEIPAGSGYSPAP